MKVELEHYQQENGYGCGLYAVANMLQDKSLITQERLNKSKIGNNIGQLNKWLIDSGYDIYIEVLQYNKGELIDIYDLSPKGNSLLWLPFCIVVETSCGRNHMIGCKYMENGTIVVHDSLKETYDIYTSFELFKAAYPCIISYEMLMDFDYNQVGIVE